MSLNLWVLGSEAGPPAFALECREGCRTEAPLGARRTSLNRVPARQPTQFLMSDLTIDSAVYSADAKRKQDKSFVLPA